MKNKKINILLKRESQLKLFTFKTTFPFIENRPVYSTLYLIYTFHLHCTEKKTLVKFQLFLLRNKMLYSLVFLYCGYLYSLNSQSLFFWSHLFKIWICWVRFSFHKYLTLKRLIELLNSVLITAEFVNYLWYLLKAINGE